MTLRAATSSEELLAAPVGRYVTGTFYVGWVYSPTLIGTVYFGRPAAGDFPALEPLFALPGHRALRSPYDVLVDCRRLEALPPDAFEFLLRYLDGARKHSGRMRRVAIVRPPGHAGIVLAGVFYELVQSNFVAALFADGAEAAAWLGNRGAVAASEELDRLVDAIRGDPPELRRLNAWLQAHPGGQSLQTTAAHLRLSPRSLQRMLRKSGTSFRRQIEHARVRLAERLLVEQDLKLEVVARRIGYSTLAHFTNAFRRATGEPPSEFRRRRRLVD
jgi:AraC-like DNA-binding protein